MNTSDVTSLRRHLNDLQSRDFSTSMLLSSSEIIVTTVLTLITIFVGVMANSLVIISGLLKQGYFDNPTNLLLLSQAVSDGVFCLVTGSTSICNLYYWIFETHFFIGKSIALASIESTVSLTINRFISVYWPLEYPRWVTAGRVKFVVALKWSLSALVCITNLVGQRIKAGELQRNTRYLILLSCTIVLTCHVFLYRKSVHHRKAIKSQIHVITGIQAGREADFRSVRSLAIVTITFIGGWLPVALVGIVVDRDKKLDVFYRHIIMLTIFPLLSSALNPFIYYFRSQNFRLFSQRLLRLYIAPHLEFGTRKCRTIDSFLRQERYERKSNVFNTKLERVGAAVIPISDRSTNVCN